MIPIKGRRREPVMTGTSGGGRRAADGAVGADESQFPEDERGRTETGEGGLDEVQPDEAGEKQPPRRNEMGEDDAQQNEAAGKKADKRIGFHLVNYMSIYAYTCKQCQASVDW